ncbi:GNAT family N-acetyltransferase [Roseovarius sp. SYSU LYC5161]|uniref:GNAT family N-acetyltransferase n=1 Tax=Roseovarius halophilus (ex Wu et al. 2025) TaxID=3376060 RepID=UPI00399AD34B
MSQAPLLERGRYMVRIAETGPDLAAARALRRVCFGPGDAADDFDSLCQHLLILDRAGAAACTFRLRRFDTGAGLAGSYTAGFYDLGCLATRAGPMIELGRFCIRPGETDPDILRLAWATLTALVDRAGAAMLLGCASFPGTDPAPFAYGFALLAERHLAPPEWRPGRRAARTVPLAGGGVSGPDASRALPTLLRSYLGMGGRVSDHAVIDEDLGTLHVFMGLEVAAIPPARARALRAMAEGVEIPAGQGRGPDTPPLAGGGASA